MSIEFHKAAIAFHQAEIAKLEGTPVPSGFDVNDWRSWWPAMKDQFAKEDESVNEEFDIGRIVTAYKPVIDAAQRESWPSNLGGTYWVGNYKTAAALRESLKALMKTTQYAKWAADSRNAHLVPKGAPE